MQSAWIREAGGSNYIPLGLVYVFAKDLYNVQKELLGYAETLLILCQDKRAGASCTHTIFHRSNIEKISSLMLERLLRGRFTKVYRAKHEKYVNHHAQVLALSKKRRLTYEEIRSMIREGIQVQIPSQPHCLEKVEVHVIKELQEKAGTFAESVFSALCEPEERSSITQERIDWLKLCIQMKGKSVDEKKAAIKIHFESHELGNASEYVGNTNSEDFYSQLMEKEAGNTKELQELENKNIVEEKKQLIKKYDISAETQDLCKQLSEIAFIRLESHLRWIFYLNLLYKHVAEITAAKKITDEGAFFELIADEFNVTPFRNKTVEFSVFFLNEKSEPELYINEQAEQFIADNQVPITPPNTEKLQGFGVYHGKVEGRAYLILERKPLEEEMKDMKDGDILVCWQTKPSMMPAIRKASAIVVNEGGIISHAAIVSRELKIPCIQMTRYATDIFKTGDIIVVDTEKGVVYKK